ncbi:TRAP transporter small permease [Rhodoferax sp. U2-2l]|uniref:TRAP transporter small permease n=1 Tax=Rhodoferax sp. U2-2l TaxID=2884000 RepID=UPI001D0A1A66|nr:TRAP transporter small permease [Rhodoferax sp. U2-2l]MCB8747494.1 TRAP transporter small permease [Rhodoferax sp. U2-2l]
MSELSKANPAERLLRWLMVLIIGSMTTLVFLNVVLRYGFNSNLSITEEIGRYLFVWLTFLGGISAFVRNRHVRVDTFLQRMPPNMQRMVGILSDLAMLACCILILIGGWQLTKGNMANYLPISDLPVATLYFASVPFSVIVGVLLMLRVWRQLSQSGKGASQ